MDAAQKKIFQSRIAQADRKELLLIHLEMLVITLKEAEEAGFHQHVTQRENKIHLALEMIKKLVESLDFKYDFSADLLVIYQRFNQSLITALRKDTSLAEEISFFDTLRNAFAQVPYEKETGLMQNSETIYAGLTYDKHNQLTETVENIKRGLQA